MEEYLMHKAKGWTKKNHKYLNRIWKNGKWFYVYKNGRKYNRIQDWYGIDERDAFNDAVNRQEKYENERFKNGQSYIGREFNARRSRNHRLQIISGKKQKEWEKTLDYKVTAISSKLNDIAISGANFIDNALWELSNKKQKLFPKKRKKK